MTEKIKNEIGNQKNLFWSLIAGIVLCFSFYVYSVTDTVYSAVLRAQAEKTIAGINRNIEELESKYAGLKSGITAEVAQKKGFTNIASAEFIYRGTSGKSLSLNAGL